MTPERNETAPPAPGRARSTLPTWQIVLLLVIVAGAYWVTREPQPPLPNADHPQREATPTSSSKPRGQLPGPDDAINDRDSRGASAPDDQSNRRSHATQRQRSAAGRDAMAKYTIPDVVVRDRDNRIAWRGTVDLTPTIARIEAGERLRFANDGSVFQNRERRLPRERAGYYHEYVHPTPGLSGPGPQRVIVGGDGEIYYTADHYRTFTTIRGP